MRLFPEFEFELSNDLLFYVIALELLEQSKDAEQDFISMIYEDAKQAMKKPYKNPTFDEMFSAKYLEYTIIKDYSEYGIDKYADKLYNFMLFIK